MTTRAAFREMLGLEHATLMEELLSLEGTLGVPPGNGAANTVQRLAAVQARLADHFAFEERDGYMAHVLERSPHMHRVVEELLAEHRQLAQSLAALIDGAPEAVTAQALDHDFRQKVCEWVVRVRRHEALENRLVQDTCNRDMAAED